MENRNHNKREIRLPKRIFNRIVILCLIALFVFLSISSANNDRDDKLIKIVFTNGRVVFASVIDITKDNITIETKQNNNTQETVNKKDIINISDVENAFLTIKLIRERFGDSKKIALPKSDVISDIQKKILDQSYKLLGAKPKSLVNIRDKRFSLDCIGTVSAIFYSLGLDIRKDFGKYSGNGVSRLFQSLQDHNAITKKKIPDVGDLIFWDNTWDKNGNGINGDDPLTHVGIVVKSEDDGTVYYLHENYVFGVIVERMNLFRPTVYKDESGKVINSAMYAYSSQYKHPVHWLSGDLWKIYGTILSVKDHYQVEQ